MHDLLIKGGTVIDGSGAPRFTGDIAIDGDRIAAVGPSGSLGPAKQVVDATGLLVTPGFVDVHTHYDAQVTWDPMLSPSSWHGVTTVVMGSCGVGFAPAKPDRHEWLIALMEGVEDIPGAAMTEGITWGWETFPEYMDAIEKLPHAIDFAAQIPHGALRAYVMGERGAGNEEATPEDIAEMSRLVAEALEAGALGFSTSRTTLHKSIDGECVPGTFATRDEIFGIGEALKATGKGVYQLACEHTMVPQEFVWMRELAQDIDRPVCFNLSQTDFAPKLWKEVVDLLDSLDDEKLVCQVAGRAIGIVMSWELTAHPFAGKPTWNRLAELPHAERHAALRTEEVKQALLTEKAENLGLFEMFVTQSWQKMFKLGNYEPTPDMSVMAEAKRRGCEPIEVAYEWLMEEDADAKLYFPLFNYVDGNLDALRELHQHPRTRMGLSDGGAHCGAICDGGMPTFMLTHWGRDRENGLPLEHVVWRQTRQTAELFGLNDRGLLKPGMKADVNLIDFEKLGFDKAEVVHDLPAGGRRLIQRARGYEATYVSGVPIFEKGVATGKLPGQLIRG
jgi:N-acyl-D-amino-acid deacylase